MSAPASWPPAPNILRGAVAERSYVPTRADLEGYRGMCVRFVVRGMVAGHTSRIEWLEEQEALLAQREATYGR